MAGGRSSKYHTHVEPKLLLIEAWARDGLTIDQIAEKLGIASSTFFVYKDKYLELSESLKKGQEVVDVEVENALLKKALGIVKTINKPIKLKKVLYSNGKRISEEEYIEYAEEEVYIPPDTTAQIFWLKNRRPETWRDKKDIDANVGGGISVVFDKGMSKDE